MSKTNVFFIVLGVAALLAAVLVYKTASYPFAAPTPGASAEKSSFPPSQAQLDRFAGGLRIETVGAVEYDKTDFGPFEAFKTYLPQAYPKAFAAFDFETVNEHAIVLRWKGKDSSRKPILFLSHYDVVPAVEDDKSKWSHPPFSGAMDQDTIYGRGALDMKGMLFGLMEAATALLEEGFQPDQDIWFSFGHDEETGGRQGAVHVAQYFAEKGIRFESVFDEGGVIAGPGSLLPALDKPVALVGLGEKGFLTLVVTVSGAGGHSSMPPEKSSLVYAAEIVEKLNAQQMPARVIPPVEAFLGNVGGDMDFSARMAIANRWLLEKQLFSSLSKSPSTNALIRTTTAVTMLKGSDAPNVIAPRAEIVVNFRILPGDTVEDVMAHVRKICEGYDVTMTDIQNTREASNLSSETGRGFQKIREITLQLYPDAVVSPYITIGGTDSYKYESVSDSVYRFMPILASLEQQQSIHNDNEHITREGYGKMIEFFKRMMTDYGK